jgi:hypothetical protein
MASTSEQGHEKNVYNLEILNTYIAGYGTAYNPAKASIKAPALVTLATTARTQFSTVKGLMPAYTLAVSARETAFEPLPKLMTRVLASIKSSSTTDRLDENINSIIKKIKGSNTIPKKTDEEKTVLAAEGKSVKEISVSRMSYESRVENLDLLIKYLSGISQYAPNEADLKVSALTTLSTDLKSKNAAVTTALAPFNNARIARNALLHTPVTGLVDTALDAKTYIKSLFGASSPQYKQISNLSFRNIKI